MSRKNVLTVAVLMGALTTCLVYLFLAHQGGRVLGGDTSAAAASPVYVAVPKETIRPMQLLRADMFRLKKISHEEAPRHAVTSLADVNDHVSTQYLPAGQPVEHSWIASRGPELGLPFAVRPPRRAVTIALDPIIGVAGFPKPGDRVDVLATFDTQRGVGMVTRTVLQDVEILAFGSDTKPTEKEEPNGKEGEARPQQTTATLAVLPAEAEKLILAESRGKLRLALRPIEDDTYRARSGVTEVQVTGVRPRDNEPGAAPAPKPAVAQATPAAPASQPSVATTGSVTPAAYPVASPVKPSGPRTREIEVIRGTAKEVVTVKDPRR
jgi:pilus assembly protein CpaB